MATLTEINAETNKSWLRWKLVGIEWLSVIVASIAVLISLVAAFAATQANIRSEMLEQDYKELEREYRLAQLAIDDFKIAMVKSGIELEHDGEKP